MDRKNKATLCLDEAAVGRVCGSEEAVKVKLTRTGGVGKGKTQHNTYDRTLKPQRGRAATKETANFANYAN
jgi:hypothetical protein